MTVSKRPYEQFPVSLDFSANLAEGETITLDTVVAETYPARVDSTARLIATDPAPAVEGSSVAFTVEDGTSGEKHLAMVRVITSAGQKLQGDIWVDVVEAI
jgi:hypothetical protein